MYEKHTDQLLSSQSEEIMMLKGKMKHNDKEHEKTLKYEAARSINHKPHRIRTTSGPPPLNSQ